jgi:hypothetical protein
VTEDAVENVPSVDRQQGQDLSSFTELKSKVMPQHEESTGCFGISHETGQVNSCGDKLTFIVVARLIALFPLYYHLKYIVQLRG